MPPDGRTTTNKLFHAQTVSNGPKNKNKFKVYLKNKPGNDVITR